MSNPPTPIIPNFQYGVGQLVTYRVDFASHTDGAAFRHNATMIDLFPYITINSTTATTVQSAIALLATAVSSITIPNATTTSLGIVRLAGDLQGTTTTATAPRVSGLQGYPIANSTPSSGNVLTWTGSSWSPQSISVFPFASNISPIISQTSPSTDTATHNTTIQAQSSYSGASININGANLILKGGSPTGAGKYGLVNLGAGITLPIRTITTSYIIDTSGSDYTILCNSGAAINLTLPLNTSLGRVLVIKDISGNAATNPITILPHASEEIEGLAVNYILETNNGTLVLQSDVSGNWWKIR